MSKNREIYNFFTKLDRSLFIDNEYQKYAKNDKALPIGFEQTISQPSLVYSMTIELDVHKDSKVLEIGTGSGYQTAFLAEFSNEVYTVERVEDLSTKARERLAKLGYQNIHFKVGNGSDGWADYAPYDRIMVTAAASVIPEPLIKQLAPLGRMIIPVGEKGKQKLLLAKKDHQGKTEVSSLGKVVFVELKGNYGWKH